MANHLSDKRQYLRHGIDLPVRFSGDDISDEGVVLDLSVGGCRIRSSAMIVAGDFLGMLIVLPGRDAPLTVGLATVRWSASQEFGVEFIRMEQDQQALLRRLIQKLEQKAATAVVTGHKDIRGDADGETL